MGTLRGALPLSHIIEILRPLPIRRLAQGADFVRGIALVRGEPLPVVDLALVLGVDSGEATRFVVVRAGERKVAVAVQAVEGIQQADSQRLDSMPPLLSKAQPGIIKAIGALDRKLLLVLEAACLVPAEAWALLDQVEAG